MSDEATVTMRVPRELKESIDGIAHDLRISQSAVWKILISHYLRNVDKIGAQQMLEQVTVDAVQERQRPAHPVRVK